MAIESPAFNPHILELSWNAGEHGFRKTYLRISMPWDSDANEWAEAFQTILLALGYTQDTVVEYVVSKLMGEDYHSRNDEDDLTTAYMVGVEDGKDTRKKPSGGPEEGLQDD